MIQFRRQLRYSAGAVRSSDPELVQAQTFERQGRLREAIAAYRAVLARSPRDGEVLHSLGIALAKSGALREAAALLGDAAELLPRHAGLRANLAKMLGELGMHEESLAAYERALSLRPDLVAALRGRGAALLALGRIPAAVASIEQAVRLAPGDAGSHADLGIALVCAYRKADGLRRFERALALDPRHAKALFHRGCLERDRGDFAAALASLEHAGALQPRHAAIHHERGRALLALERAAEAVAGFDAALALSDGVFETHFYRGVALSSLGRHEEALAAFHRALALDAGSVETLNNLGVTLVHLARPAAALDCFARVLAIEENHVQAHTNAGNTLKSLQRHTEARAHFDRALALAPDDPMAQWSQALLALTLGDFRGGWPLYESRLRLAAFQPVQRHRDAPRWSAAEPLAGRRLLVHAEQGLGDTLQFCRYLTPLAAGGADVIFEVQPELKPLLASLRFGGRLFAVGEPLPAFDLACPLLSLPLALGTEPETIPGGVPYVRAEAAATAAWRQRLAAFPGRKVGLNWQGNLATEEQPWLRGRSFALAAAAPLARVPGVTLVSLQKGPGAAERRRVAFGAGIAELTDPGDTGPAAFADTAALVTALDLVITSDTVVAHLAGALGAAVWVVLHYAADWRWASGRDDTPWYPTMKLFRQESPGDWPEVFDRVARALGEWARA